MEPFPDHGSIALPQRDRGVAISACEKYQRVLVGQRVAGVAELEMAPVKFAVEIVGPDRLAGLLIQRMDFAGSARGDHAIADHLRHRVRAGADLFRKRILEYVEVAVLPDGLAGLGVESDDHIGQAPPVGGVENPRFFGDGGVAVAERPGPDLFGTGSRPGIGKAGSIDDEITILAAPDRPVFGGGGRGIRGSDAGGGGLRVLGRLRAPGRG